MSFPGNCPDIFVHDEEGGDGGEEGADLDVTKSDSRDPIPVMRTLGYLIKVTNQGPASATQVTLTDTLSNRVQFLSVTTSAGTCVKQGLNVVCDLGTIAAGGAVDVRIDVRPRRAGTISNTVPVAGAEDDPSPGNNTDTETTMPRH
jgi:uncharacterized repeat protein (TIGR01451 family)